MAESNRVLRPLAVASSVEFARDGWMGMMMVMLIMMAMVVMVMMDDVQYCTKIDNLEVTTSN